MSHLDIVRANFKARTEIQGELRSIDEAATADKRDYTDEERSTVDEKRAALKAIDDRISANLEIEGRSASISDGMDHLLGALVDRESGDVADTRSLGARFAGSDEFRSFVDSKGDRSGVARFEGLDLRAVTNVTTGAASGGALINPQRLDRVGQSFLDRRVYLSDLLPVIPVDGPVEYVKDVSPLADLANIAVEVAEGGAKPQGGPTLEVVNESPATIAAWVNLTRRVARQAPQVQAYLDGRLRYSLKRRFDAQLISGNGTSPNISGLTDRTGILTYTPAALEATAVSIRKGITEMEENEAVPEIIILNPADAELFDLTNLATAGLHAVPNVNGPSATTAWGLTQVRSNAVASGTAVLLDPMAVAILDEEAPRAYLTDSHASNFTSNILTLLVEMDAGLAVFDPAGICVVTFDYTA